MNRANWIGTLLLLVGLVMGAFLLAQEDSSEPGEIALHSAPAHAEPPPRLPSARAGYTAAETGRGVAHATPRAPFARPVRASSSFERDRPWSRADKSHPVRRKAAPTPAFDPNKLAESYRAEAEACAVALEKQKAYSNRLWNQLLTASVPTAKQPTAWGYK